MGKDTTLQIKGILILMMLWLHLYSNEDLFDGSLSMAPSPPPPSSSSSTAMVDELPPSPMVVLAPSLPPFSLLQQQMPTAPLLSSSSLPKP